MGDNGRMTGDASGAGSAPVTEFARHPLSAALQPFAVRCVGYRDAGVPPARHRGLPSPSLRLIVSLSEPVRIVVHPDPGQPGGEFDTLAGGLHTAPAVITHDGWQSGVQLDLTPLGCRVLLGLPAGELAGIDVHGHEVLGPLAETLRQRLQEAPGWAGRFSALDEVLRDRLRAADERAALSAEVAHVWQTLLRTGGAASVAGLAAETGWSDRHLRTRFREQIGLAPKAAARVIRFDRARRILQQRALAGQPLDLAGLAAGCGYSDQAHLDREFGALAGTAPSRWVVEEFRNIQVST